MVRQKILNCLNLSISFFRSITKISRCLDQQKNKQSRLNQIQTKMKILIIQMMMTNIKKITKIMKSQKISRPLSRSKERRLQVHHTILLIKIPFQPIAKNMKNRMRRKVVQNGIWRWMMMLILYDASIFTILPYIHINKPHKKIEMLTFIDRDYKTIDIASKTAHSSFFRQNKSALSQFSPQKKQHRTIDRPQTSLILEHRPKAPFATQRIKFADEIEIFNTERELQKNYRDDLSNYLQKKFRNFIVKKHDSKKQVSSSLISIENPENLNNFCSRMKINLQDYTRQQLLESILTSRRSPSPIKSAYLTNAKERIVRLIQKGRQKSLNYTQLTKRIKDKRMEQQKILLSNRRTPLIEATIKDQQWANKWKKQFINQTKRYKVRLTNKSKTRSRKNEQD